MNRTAYICIIKNDYYDVKTIVMATSEEEAAEKVIEKFKEDFGKGFDQKDISISPFADAFK